VLVYLVMTEESYSLFVVGGEMKLVLFHGVYIAFIFSGCGSVVPEVGGEGQPCSTSNTCKIGLVCKDGTCCRPICEGGECSNNGCDGSCVTCGGDIITDDGDGGGDQGADQDGGITDGGDEERARQFQSITSGGAHLSSGHYRLDLFIAPLHPVGSRSSPNYRINYGPGAVRSQR